MSYLLRWTEEKKLSWLAAIPADNYEWPKGTALHWVATSAKIKVVQLLIREGAAIQDHLCR